MPALPAPVCAALEAAHVALRMVDAGDTTAPLPVPTLDAISDAIRDLEAAARAHGVRLTEFDHVMRSAA